MSPTRRFIVLVPSAFLGITLAASAALAQADFVNWESPHVHPLALTPSGDTLLAVNTPDNRLEVFDVSSGEPMHTASIPVGADPVSVRARSDTEAWVVNVLSDSISVVDLAAGNVVRTIATGDAPADVVFAGEPPQRAFVTVSGLNQVRVWSTADLGAAPTILNIEGQRPKSLAVSPDGTRVYAAIFDSGNATTMVSVQNVSNAAGPYGGVNPPPNSGAFFDPPIAVGLPPPPRVSIIVRRSAAGQWLDDNNRNWSQFVTWNLLDHDVAIIDAGSLSVTYADRLMTTVMGVAVRADGTVTAVGTEASNEIRFAPNVQSIFVRCVMGGFDPADPAAPAITDLNPHLNYGNRTIPPATRALSIGDPRDVVWDSAGTGYVAGMGSNNVVVIGSSGQRLATIDVADGPTGLALDEPRGRLYVMNKFSARISVIDTAARVELSRRGYFDPTPAAINLGRPLLYDTHLTSGLGQSSCASCHIDGRADFLGWDLGDPQGTVKPFDDVCRQGTGNCRDWQPMKGPMVTQSLQGIVGAEAFHWRGDRQNLAEFSGAFVELQAADAEPDPAQMQLMEDFVATIKYPPNPNRLLNGGLPTALPTSGGGNGNAVNGQNLFNTAPVLPGGITCVNCHTPPVASGAIDDPRPPGGGAPLFPQPLKIVQLRGLTEKTGFSLASQSNLRGFGFNHDSSADSLGTLLGPPFTFAPGAPGQQQRRDVEAFMLSFENDTHAAVGQQVTLDGTNNNAAGVVNFFNTITPLANAGTIGLVAKGRVGGTQRGYTLVAPNALMQSDRAAETVPLATLRLAALAGAEITFTVVPAGTQTRIGIDRDRDGYYDRDELDSCGDPANTAIHPGGRSPCDVNCDGSVNPFDIAPLVAMLASGATAPCSACAGDANGDGTVNPFDIQPFLGCISP